MQQGNTKRTLVRLALGCALLGTSSVVGCAESVGDIDRTQPNLLPKSMFEGTWFVRQTVIDVPETSTFSFVGETGELDIIRWEIQEDTLVGYRAYEQVPGADSQAGRDGVDVGEQPVAEGQGEGRDPEAYKGNPIVAYPITEHVDVQREYNPRTGEQTNVISENSTDRPWHERKWIRVDWSAPQVSHWFFISTADNGATLSSYVPEDEGGTNAFHMDRNDAGEAEYFDFTERMFVRPSITGCILDLYNEGVGDCAAQEVKVRTSFAQVDEERERDYIPETYDDRRQGEFGFFRTERVTYDRLRGPTQQGVIYLANRHDMWEGSVDAEGNVVPYAERRLRPITYHLSAGYPESLYDITEEIGADYDRSFKRIAAFRRGQTVEQLEGDLMEQTGNTCLYCINRNEDGAARIGDLRYNFIYWVDSPQLTSPLGYGPSSAHPETGRIVAGMAYVYGAAIDTYATYAKDIVDLLNGDLTDESVMGGDFIRDEIAGRLSQIDPRTAERFASMSLDDAEHGILGDERVARIHNAMEDGFPEARPGWDQRRMDLIRGTSLESLLMNDEILNAHGHGHRMESLTEDLVAEMSPANWGTYTAMERNNQRRLLAERNNVWLADFADPSVAGLAKATKDSGLTGDALWQHLREQIYKAVMLHEVGHTVGLRHNFGASSDALNYFDEYWNLRTKTIGPRARTVADLLHNNCTIIDASNEAGCAEQENGRMREYQYSSIMDYGGKFNSDIMGLGRYDVAALAAGYGDIVEVFDPSVTTGMDAEFRDALETVASWRNPLFGSLGEYYHYSRYPELFGGVENLQNRQWINREAFDAEADGSPIRVPYVACYDEYRDATGTCHTWDEGADPYEISMHFVNYYRDYYVFNNFQRDRLGFSSFDVFSRVLSRYFLPLTNMYQHWLFDYGQGDQELQNYRQMGAIQGFNTVYNVLATPKYGSYERNGDTYQHVSYTPGRGDLDIEPGVGKRAFSRYDIDAGYNIFGRVLESGVFYEQLAALLALTTNDASVLGVGADVTADFRSYSIPYNIVFGDQINSLFSGVIREDYTDYAPRVVGNEVQFMNMLSAESLPASGVPIDLDTSWSTRIYTMLYGMSNLSVNYDLTFAQHAQVSLLGSGESLTPAPGFEAVTLEDPVSGRIYAAYRPETGADDSWMAADKIDEINMMVEEFHATPAGEQKDRIGSSIRNEIEDLELMRGMYQIFGRAF